MRRLLVLAAILLAGCGPSGPATAPQTRPAPGAARSAKARDCIRKAEEAIAIAPDSELRDSALNELIQAKTRIGDVVAARKLAESLPKDSREATLIDIALEQGLNGDLAGAQDTFKAASALLDQGRYGDWSDLGVAQAKAGDLAGARQTCSALPSDWKPYVWLAMAETERKAGATASAKDDLTSVRKFQRNNPDGMPALVLAWYRVGDRATAEACIAEMPGRIDQANAWAQLADLEREAGDVAGALASDKKAQAAFSAGDGPAAQRMRVCLLIARVFAQCGDKSSASAQFTAAKDDASKQFTDKVDAPRQIMAYGLIILNQRRGGDPSGAAETLQLALARIPTLPDDKTRVLTLWSLAANLATGGDMAAARARLDEARRFVIDDRSVSSGSMLFFDLWFAIEGFTTAAVSNDPNDLTWIEQLPNTSEKASAYATAAFVLGAATDSPPTTAASKP